MVTRLKVLMSAYSCEPGKGSEPEVGWQWALQVARFHDVTVLTRANNRPSIEPALVNLRGKQPLPTFVYHDRGPALLAFKRRFNAVTLYYILWQRSAREVVRRLHKEHHFDLMHHVTFAGFRYPTAVWGHGVPCVWGPIGGIESIPRPLLPWHHFGSLAHEVVRNANNLIQATPFHILPKRARATTLILASTPEMQRVFARLGFQAELMPTIGLRVQEMPFRPHAVGEGPLRILFVGNIITLKGVDLALEALAASGTNATYTLIGSGNYLESARRLADRLGLGARVSFPGRLPRQEVLKTYPDYDLFLFPSLHDTGGYAVIEAMFNELPVICLDCGGPAVAVREGCGIKVPVGQRAAVIRNLAAAIRFYDQNRRAIAEHGRSARQSILRHYDWDRKVEDMNQHYETAISRRAEAGRPASGNGSSGMGSLVNLLNQIFSLRGLLTSVVGVLMIAIAGFVSVSYLKQQARGIVTDTLPGLSYAGEANASLAQAFNRTLLMLTSSDPAERKMLHDEIEEYSRHTASCLAAYRKQIFSPEDRALYEEWIQARRDYLLVRERAISAMESDGRATKLYIYKQELLPAYDRYKTAGDRVFEYNIRQGQSRGKMIMTVCTATQFAVAGFGVLLFLLGFLFGLFK